MKKLALILTTAILAATILTSAPLAHAERGPIVTQDLDDLPRAVRRQLPGYELYLSGFIVEMIGAATELVGFAFWLDELTHDYIEPSYVHLYLILTGAATAITGFIVHRVGRSRMRRAPVPTLALADGGGVMGVVGRF